jgi:tRNA C32,U32 (ribose-2'-O)-methylase TrmJ
MLISIGSFPTLNIANLVALIAYEMKSNNDDQPWKHLRGVFYWQNMQLTR